MEPKDQFLIVVPTRNREETILTSIPSLDPLLGLVDVRVMVSDNSDEPSEKLSAYCRSKDIELIRPSAVSSMTAHWNWILESQEYRAITLMTDRTWLMTNVWLEAKSIAEQTGNGVCWEGGTFSSKSIGDYKFGLCSASSMTGKRFHFPLSIMDGILRENHIRSFTPRLLNSITFKSDYNAIRTQFGAGLSSVSPDYEYAYSHIYAHQGRSLTYLDKLGLITHSKFISNGGGMDSGVANQTAQDFIKLSGLKNYDHAPFPEELDSINGVAHELNLILKKCGREAYVDGEMVRRIQRQRREASHRKGPFRYLKTIANLIGLKSKTTLKVLPSDKPECLRSLRVRYNPHVSHILDEFAVA